MNEGQKPMLRKYLHLFFVILVGFSFYPAQLQAKEVKSSATVSYKTFNDSVREEALKRARASAWKKYVSGFNQSQKSLYKKLKPEFNRNLDDLIIEQVILGEKNDDATRNYQVMIRINVDDAAVASLFADMSAAGNQALGAASDFGNILIARTSNTKEYDAKRVSIKESQSEGVVEEESSSDGERSVDSLSSKSLERTATGGSVERKRAKVTYQVDEGYQDNLNGIMGEVLVNNGFEPMDYVDLIDYGAPYMEDLYPELSSKGTLRGRGLKSVKDAAIEAGWSFLGIGSVTIDAPVEDSATGLTKVSAKVQYKVWMIDSGKARTVASVRATTVFGLAETEDVASTEALNKAANKAMETVVAQMQKKGVR